MTPLHFWITLLAAFAPPVSKPEERGRIHESQFYIIDTDLHAARAVYIGRLMDATGKEYDRRFQGFRGAVRDKPRLVVFATREKYVEYLARLTGEMGIEHSGGLFSPADEKVYSFEGPDLEHTLKHECFHQFAHKVIGGRLPSWCDEGLAEYFGEGVFEERSGQLFLGAVPKWRVELLTKAHGEKRLLTIEHLLSVEHAQWNDDIATLGSLQYCQAWALCHFLIHADGNRYRLLFEDFLRLIDQGVDSDSAWRRVFGAGIEGLETRDNAYLRALKPAGPIR